MTDKEVLKDFNDSAGKLTETETILLKAQDVKNLLDYAASRMYTAAKDGSAKASQGMFEAFTKHGERLSADLTDRARQVLTQERQERPAILAMQE